jgi:hypothetical protein
LADVAAVLHDRETVVARQDQRHDTFLNGTSEALSTHTRRMYELEFESLQRFPGRVREDARTLHQGV